MLENIISKMLLISHTITKNPFKIGIYLNVEFKNQTLWSLSEKNKTLTRTEKITSTQQFHFLGVHPQTCTHMFARWYNH